VNLTTDLHLIQSPGYGVFIGEKILFFLSLSFSLRRVPCYGTVIDVILAKFETSFLAKFFLVSEVFN